ncbi:hypothetical protein KI387_010622 [Taxus chinensis]|uniref:Uncharacterized protein n=1 Tax=Taxus chinensis TaxID=29808 RepID=A0AA38FMR7_TAXCH|nr:hypothetical protein KI387_010622 [Taxus chinensis]
MRTFVPGQLGQRDARDVDSRRSRKPIRSRHVSPAEKGHGSPFRAVQKNLSRAALGTFGTKGRVGREKPKRPKAEKKSQRLTRGTSNGHNF